MSRSRNLADLLDGNGDVVSGALDNVPPSNDASALTTGTLPVDRVPYLGRRNLIINGAMQVAQRGTSFTHSDSYWVDRWHRSWSLNGALAIEQSTDAPVGFENSLKVTVNTTSTDNFSGTEYFAIGQYIENKDIKQLAYGTSSAKSITVSFWVKASSTATYSVGLRAKFGAAGSTYYTASRSFSINTANTWEYKTLTFSGNQTDYVNWDWGDDYGIAVNFALSVGDTIGNTQDDGEWYVQNGFGLTSTTTGSNFATLSSGETIQITGVQLEVGSVATPFEHRSYGEELALCQRYCVQVNSNNKTYDLIFPAMVIDADDANTTWQPPVTMRAAPTVYYSNAAHICINYNSGGNESPVNIYPGTSSYPSLYFNLDVNNNVLTAGQMVFLAFTNATSGGYIRFDAEL